MGLRQRKLASIRRSKVASEQWGCVSPRVATARAAFDALDADDAPDAPDAPDADRVNYAMRLRVFRSP
jgi:hypothetical protein